MEAYSCQPEGRGKIGSICTMFKAEMALDYPVQLNPASLRFLRPTNGFERDCKELIARSGPCR